MHAACVDKAVHRCLTCGTDLCIALCPWRCLSLDTAAHNTHAPHRLQHGCVLVVVQLEDGRPGTRGGVVGGLVPVFASEGVCRRWDTQWRWWVVQTMRVLDARSTTQRSVLGLVGHRFATHTTHSAYLSLSTQRSLGTPVICSMRSGARAQRALPHIMLCCVRGALVVLGRADEVLVECGGQSVLVGAVKKVILSWITRLGASGASQEQRTNAVVTNNV